MSTPVWTTACPDWERRLLAGESLIPFPPLYPDEADAAAAIFRDLPIVDAAGSPTMAQACKPWVFDFCDAVFGSYNHETGRRLIREFFLLVAKKNAKSTTAAGMMLTALLRNWRKSGEYLIIAPTLEIAQNSFKPAHDMIMEDPGLGAILRSQPHFRVITHKTTGATLKVIAADNEAVSGKKAVGVLVDELWLFGKRPNAENMLREAVGGLASRPEGFVIYLSTQSDEPPSGIFKQKLDYFRDVRDGKIDDPRSLPILYEFPKKMLDEERYKDPRMFGLTNPNMGASVDREWLESEYAKADLAGPASMMGFLAKHLNVELGLRIRANRWPGAEYWVERGDPSLTFDEVLRRSEVVVVGIDGGGLDDLFGLAVLGRDAETKDWLLWSHAWCHTGVLQRRRSIAQQLQDFQKDGDLTIVKDMREVEPAIVDIVEQIKDKDLLGAVAADSEGPFGEFVDLLAQIEVTQENKLLVGVNQGIRLMRAIKTAERRLASGTFRHHGSRMMAWCVSNLKIEATATALRATKANAGDAKIDPIMAALDAVDIMTTNPDPKLAPAYQLFFV